MPPESTHRLFNRPLKMAEGWYWVVQARQLKRGKTRAVSMMGRELVAFRTQTGKAVVMDAYCPHMGAHLAEGRVEGEAIRCFFHHWCFDEHGACVDVPSMERPPPRLQIKTWPVQEKHGLVWIWIGPGVPEHDVPEPPELAGQAYASALGKPFLHRCHPNVVMINAIDEQHFKSVHRLPGHLMKMTPQTHAREHISLANTAEVPRAHWFGRWISRFYRQALTYRLDYWYGHTGTVTMGPDFLHIYLMFTLRQTEDGRAKGQTVVFTKKRTGLAALFNPLLLFATRIAGNYFSIGDRKVFRSIRFNYQTPVPADQAIQAFIHHLENQSVAAWPEDSPRPLDADAISTPQEDEVHAGS